MRLKNYIIYISLALLGCISLLVISQLAPRYMRNDTTAASSHELKVLKFIEKVPALDDVAPRLDMVKKNELAASDSNLESLPADIEHLGFSDDGWHIQTIDSANGEGLPAQLAVGIPGTWPHKSVVTSTNGMAVLPLPEVQMLSNQKSYIYEIYASSERKGKRFAYWAEQRFDTNKEHYDNYRLPLMEAKPINITVYDFDRQPIADAEVRLSRNTVGLVTLDITTDSDGRASFEAIPGDNYIVTVLKSGFGRHNETVRHLNEESTDFIITLDRRDGSNNHGRIRINPSKSPKSVSQRSSDSDKLSSAAPLERPEPEGSKSEDTTTMQIFVADSYGGPASDAWVELWRRDELVYSGISQGRNGIEISVEAPFNGTLIAMHDGWGEGIMPVRIGEDSRASQSFTVELTNEIFTFNHPQHRIMDLDAMENALQAELVFLNSAWVINSVAQNSAAARAGITRGDKILTIRRTENGRHEVVVARAQGGHSLISLQ